jgi:hypothetical protein
MTHYLYSEIWMHGISFILLTLNDVWWHAVLCSWWLSHWTQFGWYLLPHGADLCWQSIKVHVWQWLHDILCSGHIPFKYTILSVLHCTCIRCTHFKRITIVTTIPIKYPCATENVVQVSTGMQMIPSQPACTQHT